MLYVISEVSKITQHFREKFVLPKTPFGKSSPIFCKIFTPVHETHQKSGLNMTEIPRTTALAHYNDEEFAAALTANGIKFAVTTLATDTLATNDGESVATNTLNE